MYLRLYIRFYVPFADDSYRVAAYGARGAPNRVATASGHGLDLKPAQFVRDVNKGERFTDVLEELKALQFQGVEANLVRMKGGQQRIYTGGFDGTIMLVEFQAGVIPGQATEIYETPGLRLRIRYQGIINGYI